MPFRLALALIGSFIGTAYYLLFAERRGIIAEQNSRTLHEKVVPRGGGVVFAAVFTATIALSYMLGEISVPLALAFGVGGAAAAAIGFIDDVKDVRPTIKFASQICLSILLYTALYDTLLGPFIRGLTLVWATIAVAVLLFVPVWMINLYNFIDGIDGMAITGAVYICGAAIIVLLSANGSPAYVAILGLLLAACLGFVHANLPPASVFMGDAGSIFLGFSFAALMILTVVSGQMSPWTWLVILGYYIGDTTTTTASRFFLVKKWYGVHRSHAYQNLARIYKSHAKVTYGVAAYDVLWALPLAIWSARQPQYGPLAAALAIVPVVLWTLRFGPRLSPD